MRNRKVKPKIRRGHIYRQAIMMAETLFPEPKQGAKKRAWVIKFINEQVNVPILNERQEEKVIGLIVDAVCDVVKALTNR